MMQLSPCREFCQSTTVRALALTSHDQRKSQIKKSNQNYHHSMKCLPPYDGTSDSEEEQHHNTWNMLLELLTLPGSSPATQRCIHDWELCRVALSCHFALGRYSNCHGVRSRRATAIAPKHSMRAACFENVRVMVRQW